MNTESFQNIPAPSPLLTQIRDAAKGAGEIMLHASFDSSSVMSKEGHANFVTIYDKKVQEFLIRHLSKILPEAHFVGEEEGKESFLPEYESGYTFVIDPIDGTSNFMKAYRPSVTSIALLKEGVPYIGVIYNPYTNQLFSAEKNRGAFLNNTLLQPNETPLSESLVGMGTAPYYGEEISRSAFEIGLWYLLRSIDIRRSGSAAWDLCMVAAGHTGLFFEPRLSLWDYAAGACILQEAGGIITDLYGNPLSYRGISSICAASKGVATGNYLPPTEMIK